MKRIDLHVHTTASDGTTAPEDIPELLRLGDRRMTGPTMPPQGLYLRHLWYPDFEIC